MTGADFDVPIGVTLTLIFGELGFGRLLLRERQDNTAVSRLGSEDSITFESIGIVVWVAEPL